MVNEEPADRGANPAGEPHRTSRRRLFGIAAATGIGAAMYVKPTLRELGVPGTYAQVSPGLGWEEPPPPTITVVQVRTRGYWQTHGGSTFQTSPDYDKTWDAFRTAPYTGKADNNYKPFYYSGKNYGISRTAIGAPVAQLHDPASP